MSASRHVQRAVRNLRQSRRWSEQWAREFQARLNELHAEQDERNREINERLGFGDDPLDDVSHAALSLRSFATEFARAQADLGKSGGRDTFARAAFMLESAAIVYTEALADERRRRRSA